MGSIRDNKHFEAINPRVSPTYLHQNLDYPSSYSQPSPFHSLGNYYVLELGLQW